MLKINGRSQIFAFDLKYLPLIPIFLDNVRKPRKL